MCYGSRRCHGCCRCHKGKSDMAARPPHSRTASQPAAPSPLCLWPIRRPESPGIHKAGHVVKSFRSVEGHSVIQAINQLHLHPRHKGTGRANNK